MAKTSNHPSQRCMHTHPCVYEVCQACDMYMKKGKLVRASKRGVASSGCTGSEGYDAVRAKQLRYDIERNVVVGII